MPELNAAYAMGLASRLAHIISAVVLVGGLVYLRMMVVSPQSVRVTESSDSATQYFFGLRRRWAICVMACAGLLIVSGLYNYIVKVRAEKFPLAYHSLFGVKFLLGLFVMFAASIVVGKTEAAQRARARIRFWLNLSILAAILVIAIASTLRTIGGSPKPVDASASAAAESEDWPWSRGVLRGRSGRG